MSSCSSSPRPLRSVTLLACLLGALSPFACVGSDPVIAAATDAGTTDSGTVDAAPPPPGSVVYVSAVRGDDANTGYSQDKPRKTIKSALNLAASSPTVPITEIRVCAGTYTENLTVTTATSLRGGYSCDTWARAAAFGFDANFPDVNRTVVQGAADAPTLTFDVPTATRTTLVDGLQILAANTTAQAAIKVVTGAPSIEELQAFGGVAVGGGPGAASVGIQVVGGEPNLSHLLVDGGRGTGSDYGSVAVLLSGGKASLHDSRLEAGNGKGVVGAAGILVNGGGPYTGANALSRLIVHAGRPIGSNNPFIGAQIRAGKVEFVTSIVLGVDGADCSGTLCVLYGIAGSPGTDVVVRGNSIEPGNFVALSPPALPSTAAWLHRGIYSNGALVAENNLVSAGGLTEGVSGTGAQTDGGAIELGPDVPKAAVRYNTLVLGAPTRRNVVRYGLVSMAAGVEVAGNLVIREPQSGTGADVRAFDFRPCGDKPFALFDGNRAIGDAPNDVILGPPTTTCSTTVKIGNYSFNGIFKNGDGGDDNTALPESAREQAFGTWNADAIARAISERKLVPGAGPTPKSPCALQTKAPGPATDALGKARGVDKTAGAFERNGNDCTP
jgi:hypothetical protein